MDGSEALLLLLLTVFTHTNSLLTHFLVVTFLSLCLRSWYCLNPSPKCSLVELWLSNHMLMYLQAELCRIFRRDEIVRIPPVTALTAFYKEEVTFGLPTCPSYCVVPLAMFWSSRNTLTRWWAGAGGLQHLEPNKPAFFINYFILDILF